MKQKYYVGLGNNNLREIFKSLDEPTRKKYGQIYNAVIGPFRTKRGALFMKQYGMNNPHCRCVKETEKLAKIYDNI